jgi:hypothetical protein
MTKEMPAGSQIAEKWPEESREAAQNVISQYGEPEEATEHQLVWYECGQWKRIVASKEFHNFPAPHIDYVECFIDYRAPPDKFSALAELDGSVMVDRTAGEVSARCHDEQANFVAPNLMHDIVSGSKSVEEARQYYPRSRGLPPQEAYAVQGTAALHACRRKSCRSRCPPPLRRGTGGGQAGRPVPGRSGRGKLIRSRPSSEQSLPSGPDMAFFSGYSDLLQDAGRVKGGADRGEHRHRGDADEARREVMRRPGH